MSLGGSRYASRGSIAVVAVAVAAALATLALALGSGGAGPATASASATAPAGPVFAGRLDPSSEPADDRGPRSKHGRSHGLGEIRNAAGEPLAVDGACEESLRIAANQGLTLPAGWKLRCPGPGLDWEGGSHWGVTCPYASCPEGAGPYVSISNPTYYVVAHELCHANFGNAESMADSCAAKHGASLETSPYR